MIRRLLTPEAQRDPYTWCAVYSAHCWLALGPFGAIAIGWDVWTAAWVTPLLYLTLWEGLQLFLVRRVRLALLWDALADTTAVALACHAAACTRHGMYYIAFWCWCASVAVMFAGWMTRDR